MRYETIWTFKTARFEVRFEVAPEDMDPRDSFDESHADTIDAIDRGLYAWFQAKVAVYLDGHMIGADYLGGCCYLSVQQFCSMHREYKQRDYFGDMVRQAIAEARKTLGNPPQLRKIA